MGKGQQPMVGARVPHSWKNQISGITQETGKKESDIVREALAQYLDRTDPDSVDSLMKRVATLERQIKKLSQLVTS
jgi:RHH-type rel operon transcriptional repressor/antitoxin RelB